MFSVLGGFLLFAVVLPLVYFTHSVSFQIMPQLAANNAAVAISDRVGLVLFDGAYILGGQATMHFEAPGFISQSVEVDFQKGAKHLIIEMQEAPLNVVITTEPPLPQTRWFVNGVYTDTAERFAQALLPGATTVEANHEFYRAEILQVDVQIGEDFTHQLVLAPLNGVIDIGSEPAGAQVVINGDKMGITPIQISAMAGGLYGMQIILAGYETVEEKIVITNKRMEIKRDYRLKLSRSAVQIKAQPVGGVLLVNGVATSVTARLALAAGKKHIIQYKKSGYIPQSQEVLLEPNEDTEISFQLKQEMGEVVIRSSPAADILVNGKSMGATPQTLRLQALPQKITLMRVGYRAVERLITPTASSRILIDEQLKTESAARLSQATPFLTATADIEMKFFDPRILSKNRFTMGSPNNEKFRRANEFQRQVELTKPFYVSTTEITEQQFAQYKPIQVKNKKHPVRNVSWLAAAGFANWLSLQDGLQPAYQFVDGQLQSFNSIADGYRLLSEAEWEWLARVAGRSVVSRFIWGDETTIPKNSGNFADQSAKGSVSKYIPRYNDGFANVAPVASFPADVAGLYDMAGNVSEWVHDVYDLQPPRAGQVETDPFGGRHHNDDGSDGRVVKGASFRSASVIGLRSSFRDGLSIKRDDVGFRIARYLYGQE